jgi:hypothetical protein
MEGTRLLLQEINANTITSKMIRFLLDVIQMEAGIGQPILEENRPLSYIEWGWIPCLRDFLLHINAKIMNATANPPTFRAGDAYIMNSDHLPLLSRKEQILINRCRLYLQVECLSDITTSDGTRITSEWISPTSKRSSRSTKSWPIQGDPGPEAWKIWGNYLNQAFTNGNGILINKLQNWTGQPHREYLAYYSKTHNQLWLYIDKNRWSRHQLLLEGRRTFTFKLHYRQEESSIPIDGVPIDVLYDTDEVIITSTCKDYTPSREQKNNNYGSLLEFNRRGQHNGLFYDVDVIIDEDTIRQTLARQAFVDVASDGSHDQISGAIAYGWVIAINDVVAITGKGLGESHPQFAGSFRAEAYGLASASAFSK